MSDATFEKLTRSDKTLYGPRKLLLCGFTADTQPKFEYLLKMLEMTDVPLVWASVDHAGMRMSELLELPAGSGGGADSGLPRAIIVSGITGMQLHGLMGVCRKAGMKQALWATVTPSSENWVLSRLLTELSAEREALKSL